MHPDVVFHQGGRFPTAGTYAKDPYVVDDFFG